MLTLEHLKIYYRYSENIDAWARSGSKKENDLMTDEIWHKIEEFKANLNLINNGLTSKDYENEILKSLKIEADIETQEYLLNNKNPNKSWLNRLFG